MGNAGLLIGLLVLILPAATVSIKYKSSDYKALSEQTSSARVSHSTKLAESLHRLRRQSENSSPGAVQIRQFHLTSKIYSRFATVQINSEVANAAAAGSHEIAFTVQVPESAFMSNFTMTVGGVTYVAKVLEKVAAQEKYEDARARNQTAGQVKHDRVDPARGMELFTVNVNVAPGSSANFILTYNELLERRHGNYTQRLFLQPGGIVANMSVRAFFAEKQGFESFSFTLPGANTAFTSSTEQALLMASPDSRELTFSPSEAVQRSYDPVKGIQGEISILYDVSHKSGGGNIIIQNQHFVHYFAPLGLSPLLKNILFIIDISGSMGGIKIEQARLAMLKILDDVAQQSMDVFNILLFDDKLEKWKPEPMSASVSNTNMAKGYVKEKLTARGSTDIYQALMTGLDILLGDRLTQNCKRADMIVFLTDGDPTAGEFTDRKMIVERVTNKNLGRASIFSLGFGFDMDFSFLSQLSENNKGFARRIYSENDAALQLEDFYDEIGTPVLCDVSAMYSRQVVEVGLLTMTQFPLFFHGKEIVIAGKTTAPASQLDLSSLEAQLQGSGAGGVQHYSVDTDDVLVIEEEDMETGLTEKLWSYMYIKKLLKEMERMSSAEVKNATQNEALQVSLKYGFVTPLTSFSIVVGESQRDQSIIEAADFSPDHIYNKMGLGSVTGGRPHFISASGMGMSGGSSTNTSLLSKSAGLFLLAVLWAGYFNNKEGIVLRN